MTEITVRPARPDDKSAWLALFQAYCLYYKHELPAHVSEWTWSQITAEDSAINAFVAVDDSGRILGIANYILHPHTWSSSLVCYLEDLFVDPDYRKGGVGRALIDMLIKSASTNKWARVYWMTETDNVNARKLYDHYVKADGFVRYVVTIDPAVSF